MMSSLEEMFSWRFLALVTLFFGARSLFQLCEVIVFRLQEK